MIGTWTIHENGNIISTFEGSDEDLRLNMEDGQEAFEGYVDPDTEYIKEGEKYQKPTKPGAGYKWDNDTEAWLQDQDTIDKLIIVNTNQIRLERDSRLAFSDWTQLSDNALSTEVKEAWQTYRQELRDLMSTLEITESTTIDTIVWPTQPE